MQRTGTYLLVVDKKKMWHERQEPRPMCSVGAVGLVHSSVLVETERMEYLPTAYLPKSMGEA